MQSIKKYSYLCSGKYFDNSNRFCFSDMKKVVNVSLGGRSFVLEEEAYRRLRLFLEHFRAKLTVPEGQKGEVMEEIEGRIAELFEQKAGGVGRVVTLPMAEEVASALGMPDGSAERGASASFSSGGTAQTSRKLYRDMDNKAIAGVCSGLAAYLDVDVTLVRLVMLLAFVLGSAGFWIYVILWIVMPQADTPAKKCDMHGLVATAENMSRFAREGYRR